MSGGDIDPAAATLVVVVPPFASADRPSLGAHIVAATAMACGWPAAVVYANLGFAARVGARAYQRLCHHSTGDLIGERIFAAACYGDAAEASLDADTAARLAETTDDPALSLATLQRIATDWADEEAARLAALPAAIVGFTSTFEQTAASIALARRVRRLAPGKRLILGGSNVEGSMADGLVALAPDLDHFFAGESEASLVGFLAALDRGETPPRIVRGAPSFALDALPPPDYRSYYRQLAATVGIEARADGIRPEDEWLPYESSRGCWWGAKHHCTFCGLNADGMAYRQKSPGKVLAEIEALSAQRPEARLLMVDNIMPYGFFRTLLPALAARDRPLDLFYEQKANIDHARMSLLRDAGVRRIQPGIEALDDRLLALMDKGSSLRVNLDCLRWARALGIDVAWNLLVDFPGEPEDAHARTAALAPLLAHLQPPSGVSPLSIERFSPYFDRPTDYGIAALKPLPAYAATHPGRGDCAEIAYHFIGDYQSGWRRRPDLGEALEARVAEWRDAWTDGDSVPVLEVVELSPGRLLLLDTRPVTGAEALEIDAARARACLAGRGGPGALAWAEARGLVWRDGERLLPLATAAPDVLRAAGAIA